MGYAWPGLTVSEKRSYFGKHLFAKQELITRVQDFEDKTLRLVTISLLISAIQRVLRFFSGYLLHKSNRKRFSCICIDWYKHSRRWENSRQLCKPSASSRVCITVSNSPNPSRVYMRLCQKTENVFYCLNANRAVRKTLMRAERPRMLPCLNARVQQEGCMAKILVLQI